MQETDLQKLTLAVEYLLTQVSTEDTIQRLRLELAQSTEPFVWSTIDLDSIPVDLPSYIKSGWIFHLRQDIPSGCHYHPNSVQHMAMVVGRGMSNIGGKYKAVVPFTSTAHALEERWSVIDLSVPHEFFPEQEDMTVISFHTCTAEELEEVACTTGGLRHYQSPER